MELIKVNIIENHEITGDYKNALQYIERAETAMFLDYNDNLNGAIYMMKESTFKWVAVELDTIGIDYLIISKHNMKD